MNFQGVKTGCYNHNSLTPGLKTIRRKHENDWNLFILIQLLTIQQFISMSLWLDRTKIIILDSETQVHWCTIEQQMCVSLSTTTVSEPKVQKHDSCWFVFLWGFFFLFCLFCFVFWGWLTICLSLINTSDSPALWKFKNNNNYYLMLLLYILFIVIYM